jgi:DNA-directed RNA polymerase beta' subunit
MGKRVDFSARTVITPDPNLRIDQVNKSDTFFTIASVLYLLEKMYIFLPTIKSLTWN